MEDEVLEGLREEAMAEDEEEEVEHWLRSFDQYDPLFNSAKPKGPGNEAFEYLPTGWCATPPAITMLAPKAHFTLPAMPAPRAHSPLYFSRPPTHATTIRTAVLFMSGGATVATCDGMRSKEYIKSMVDYHLLGIGPEPDPPDLDVRCSKRSGLDYIEPFKTKEHADYLHPSMKQYMTQHERSARARELVRDGLGDSASNVVFPYCTGKKDVVHGDRRSRFDQGQVELSDGRRVCFGGNSRDVVNFSPEPDDIIFNGEGKPHDRLPRPTATHSHHLPPSRNHRDYPRRCCRCEGRVA